ncbi:hypothetical protein EVAR_91463_1 [Eumeta japonica]|uniref:Uncharacterized protein n=1 Tax=Eumeta variegata TaxID=151549 RepID=A0A4C1WZK9_EUMVA|nr:hypothetical protein EVAR_91463_1 [Eumeta japonica]
MERDWFDGRRKGVSEPPELSPTGRKATAEAATSRLYSIRVRCGGVFEGAQFTRGESFSERASRGYHLTPVLGACRGNCDAARALLESHSTSTLVKASRVTRTSGKGSSDPCFCNPHDVNGGTINCSRPVRAPLFCPWLQIRRSRRSGAAAIRSVLQALTAGI